MKENIKQLVTQINGKSYTKIVIIGSAASGKTSLALFLRQYLNEEFHILHTDDYLEHGPIKGLYLLLAKASSATRPTIIEGILGYRLLRKGLQTGDYAPDLIIELSTNWERIHSVYQTERDTKKLKYVIGQVKSCNKVLQEYIELLPENQKPDWIKL